MIDQARETKFIDQLLLGWASWARRDGINLRPTSAGQLWQISAIIEARDSVIVLTDDAFVLIDGAIAKLPRRLCLIIKVEYQDGRPSEAKARSIGLNRLAYRQRLNAAQWALYAALLPSLDDWRPERVQIMPVSETVAITVNVLDPLSL